MILPFNENPKKRVLFENDSEKIRKPKPTKIATYNKLSPPNIIRVRTSEEIEKEDFKAAMTFLAKKRNNTKKAWKPSFHKKKVEVIKDLCSVKYLKNSEGRVAEKILRL